CGRCSSIAFDAADRIEKAVEDDRTRHLTRSTEAPLRHTSCTSHEMNGGAHPCASSVRSRFVLHGGIVLVCARHHVARLPSIDAAEMEQRGSMSKTSKLHRFARQI